MAAGFDVERLVSLFEFLGDWEERYRQIIDLGKKLEPLDEACKTPQYKVHGCTSQVWMIAEFADQAGEKLMKIKADSDAHIVRGLIAILIMIFSNQTAAKVLELDPKPIFERLGLDKHLSPMRSNGLHSMVTRIKALAAAA